ncbi:hypothetical protein Gotur_032447 [Gossypium turneri]
MEDVKEVLDGVKDRIDNWKEQSRDYVKMSLDSIMDKLNELFNSHRDKLSERNDALKARMIALNEGTMATKMALSTRIEELKVDLALSRAVVGEGVSSAALSNEDVSKLKEFVRTRSVCDVDNFLWRMENYFRAKVIVDDAVKVNTASMFLTDIALLWWRGKTIDKRQGKIGTWQEFQCELKGQFYLEFFEEEARAKLQCIRQRGTVGEQEVEQRGVQNLSEALTVVEFVAKLGLGKGKLRSSKFEERSVYEKDHKEDVVDGNGNGDNGGNGKPRVGKKKPKSKRDKLKCFLCNDPHILKKYPKKSVLSKKQKPVGKALGLGSSARGVKTKEDESEKKSIQCFLCRGLHRLQKCPKKFDIEGDDGVDKEPKKLGSSKGKAKAKRAKRSKKKRGLPRKEKVSLSSNLVEKVVMKTVKLGLMRLNSSEASELAELSTRLPPIGEVGGASNFKENEVMQVEQLTRVNATSRMVRENVTGRSSNLVTIAPNASDGGLLCRWGSFGPQELA